MLQALAQFFAALNSLPAGWRLWVAALVLMNLVIPSVFIARREARVVIAVFLIQGIFMFGLFWTQGFTRLLGLAHLGWFGLIYSLWKPAAEAGPKPPWAVWLRALLLVDAISLSIDVVDVIRYLLGERTPMM